jgi:PAS domain S-box-containing protein
MTLGVAEGCALLLEDLFKKKYAATPRIARTMTARTTHSHRLPGAVPTDGVVPIALRHGTFCARSLDHTLLCKEQPVDRDAAIILADRTGTITYWSPAASELFGFSADEALGASLDLVVPPDYRDRHWSGFRRVMEGGPPHFEGRAANIPVRCKDGQVLPFPARFVVIRDPHDRPVGAMAVASPRRGSEQAWAPV